MLLTAPLYIVFIRDTAPERALHITGKKKKILRLLNEIIFTDYSPPTTVVLGARMITLVAYGQNNSVESEKIQDFIVLFP